MRGSDEQTSHMFSYVVPEERVRQDHPLRAIRRMTDEALTARARRPDVLSDEHFTVDGTLLEAWASLKSFRRTDDGPAAPPDDPGNPTVNFHGESRRNETHQSTTDPDARLARKGNGREAKLSYAGHVLLDNRHGLVANVCVTAATGTAEREAALLLPGEAPQAATGGGDKGFR